MMAGSRSTTIVAPRIGRSFPAELYDMTFGQGRAQEKKVSRLALFRARIALAFQSIRAAMRPLLRISKRFGQSRVAGDTGNSTRQSRQDGSDSQVMSISPSIRVHPGGGVVPIIAVKGLCAHGSCP
jgi:hypothetical protein